MNFASGNCPVLRSEVFDKFENIYPSIHLLASWPAVLKVSRAVFDIAPSLRDSRPSGCKRTPAGFSVSSLIQSKELNMNTCRSNRLCTTRPCPCLLFLAGLVVLLLSLLAIPDSMSAASGARSLAKRSRTTVPPAVKRLYKMRCLKCHGPRGRGSDMRDIMPEIPDFTGRKWQERHSDPQLLTSILDGKGKQMPAFSGKISRDQAQKLLEYVRSFGPLRSRAKAAEGPRDHFDKEFARLQKQFDQLQRQLEQLDQKGQAKRSRKKGVTTTPISSNGNTRKRHSVGD
jgi:mono/diheme cytochrome c family protein